MIGWRWGLTRITCSWFSVPYSRSCTVDSNNSYSGPSAPCPAASRTVQLPSTSPLGSPLFSTKDRRVFCNSMEPLESGHMNGDGRRPLGTHLSCYATLSSKTGSGGRPGQSPANICQGTAVWRGKTCLLRYVLQIVAATAQHECIHTHTSNMWAVLSKLIIHVIQQCRCPEGI